MLKLLKIGFVVFFVAVLFSACKSHEKCPAYGKAGGVEKKAEARG